MKYIGWLFVISVSAFASTLRVPDGYPTIQSALDALAEADTVLVSSGIYTEALDAPPFSFVLLGDVGADTAESARPVVDPAAISGSDSLCCLTTHSGTARIHDFRFRNGAAMFPRVPGGYGGIRNLADHLVLERCTFDSTYWGVISVSDSVTLTDSRFVNNTGVCLYAVAPVVATDCQFHCIASEWASVSPGGGSLLDRCNFTGTMDYGSTLLLRGSRNVVQSCKFDSCGSAVAPVLSSHDDSLILANSFEGITQSPSIININSDAVGLVVRGNRFLGNHMVHPLGGYCVAALVCTDCEARLLDSNVFVDGIAPHTKAITYAGKVRIESSHFVRMNPPEENCVSAMSGERAGVLRNNLFEHNGSAVGIDMWQGYIDARWNYWGDSTGPYHPVLNPGGLGDAVSDSVEFIPWYRDTLFFQDAPKRTPRIPDGARLAVYPNPFNREPELRLTVPRTMVVRVDLYDVLGRKARELFLGPVRETKTIRLDASGLATGVYFARVISMVDDSPLATAKLVFLK